MSSTNGSGPDDASSQAAQVHGAEIRNEFGAVHLEVVPFGRGTRLQVTSIRTGAVQMVDATVLEAMTAVSPEDLVDLVSVAIVDEPPASDDR